MIKKMDRVPSGIPGLDELIEGGFVPNSVVMIAGESGTGKTIFCTQFIWNALCIGDNGVYVTLQQIADEVRDDIAIFGRDFKRAEEMNQCRIVFIEPQDIKKIIEIILKNVKEIKAKRIVIDSISMICEYAEKRRDIRYSLGYLLRQLKRMGVTTVVSSEVEEGSSLLSRHGIEEFLVDGVIILKCGVDVVGGKPRSLYIKKMRRTKHDLNTHPFEITERGIKVIG
jgi:KaiC/GvpD/RAD55 family RecA-like ATPase